MRTKFLLLGLLGVLLAAAVSGGSAAAIATGWGKAIEVPGAATLNGGGNAGVKSISCTAAGECAAGGFYKDGSGHYQALVVTERHGRWGHAAEVPGTASLNADGNGGVNAVSCAATGECVAGGYYDDGSDNYQPFVVSEKHNHWGGAVEIPGMATLNTEGNATVNSVSCIAVGACVAGGFYKDGSGHYQAYVVSEKHGRWGHAVELPGTATLNSGGNAGVSSVSCSAVGECAVGGYYNDSTYEVFVVSEKHGHWATAVEVPGMSVLNSGGEAGLNSVSCSAVGECAAGGYYLDGSNFTQAFVVSEKHGHWGTGVELPGTATLNNGGNAGVYSISCAGPGACSAGGFYTEGSNLEAFVVSERHSRWGHAVEVPGTATLNSGGNANLYALSCGAAGECVAGGYYSDGSGHYQAFVVREKHNLWAGAIEVPGTGTLNSGGNATVSAVSCVATGQCAAGGYYEDGSVHAQAFVVGGAR